MENVLEKVRMVEKEEFSLSRVCLAAKPVFGHGFCHVSLYERGIEKQNLIRELQISCDTENLIMRSVNLGLEDKSFEEIIEAFETNGNRLMHSNVEFRLYSFEFGGSRVNAPILTYEQWICLGKPTAIYREITYGPIS